MSFSLEVRLLVPLGGFELRVEWETSEPSLGVVGASGAGKTTLLESIAGLRPTARGLVRVNGRTWLDSDSGTRLPPERRGVGYVPQDLLLFPHMDVLANVLAGARRVAAPLPSRRVLSLLELEALAHRDPATLSGGERQRVALARALCSGPELLLLDEPLASLDRPLRARILPYLLRVREEFGIPALHVSHEPEEVRALAREILVLDAGRVVGRGPAEDVLRDVSWWTLAGDDRT